MEILWKGTASVEFRAIRLKLGGNCAIPQNLYTRKLGEITVFYGSVIISVITFGSIFNKTLV